MATINKIPKCPPLRFPDFNDEWTQTTLGEILEFFPTNSFSWEQLDYSGRSVYNIHYGLIHKGLSIICSPNSSSLPCVKEDIDTSKYTLCKSGDIVIADASEDTNDVGKAIELIECDELKVLAGLHTIHGRSCLDKTAIGFKGYLFASNVLKYQMRQVAQGTKVYSISSKLISPLIISLPSLAEQKKIADFLSLIDERIHSLSETIKELKTQKAGLLNQLFSQKLRFPDFNDEWTQCFVSDFGQVVTGSTPPTSDSCNYDASDYLWASPSDLGQTKYIRKTKTMLSSKGFSLTRSLPLGSVLVSCIGIIGKVGVAVTEMSTNQQINAIIPNQSKVNSEYVYYAILNKSLAYSRLSATQVVPILSKREFERMRNQYPSLAEQKKIADFLSLIDERIEVEEQLLKKYEEQKKYLLRHMFV